MNENEAERIAYAFGVNKDANRNDPVTATIAALAVADTEAAGSATENYMLRVAEVHALLAIERRLGDLVSLLAERT